VATRWLLRSPQPAMAMAMAMAFYTIPTKAERKRGNGALLHVIPTAQQQSRSCVDQAPGAAYLASSSPSHDSCSTGGSVSGCPDLR